MSTRTERIKQSLAFKEEYLEAIRKAIIALTDGGVQSYSIGSRSLTRFDLPTLSEEERKLESEIEILANKLSCRPTIRGIGVLRRDW